MTNYKFQGSSRSQGTSTTSSNNSNPINVEFQNLTNKLTGILQNFNNSFNNTVKQVSGYVDNVFNKIRESITNINNKFVNIVQRTYENIQSEFKAGLSNGISYIFGDGLFAQYLNRAINKVVDFIFSAVGKLFSLIWKSLGLVLKAILGVFKIAAKMIAVPIKLIGNVVKNIGSAIMKSTIAGKILLWGLIIAGVIALGMWIGNHIKKIWQWIKNLASRIWNGIKEFWNKIGEGISNFFTQLWEKFRNSWIGRRLGLDDESKEERAAQDVIKGMEKVRKEQVTNDWINENMYHTTPTQELNYSPLPKNTSTLQSSPATNVNVINYNTNNNNMSSINNVDNSSSDIWGKMSPVSGTKGVSF